MSIETITIPLLLSWIKPHNFKTNNDNVLNSHNEITYQCDRYFMKLEKKTADGIL